MTIETKKQTIVEMDIPAKPCTPIKFSKEVRTAFYTTNAIESLNSCYYRLNKQKSVFPSSQALLKALYLGTFEIAKKWTMSIRNWGKVRGELEIMYPDRMQI